MVMEADSGKERHDRELVRMSIRINGKEYASDQQPRLLLVDFIRDVAKLTGTHIGCDTSNCGACTVMLNGKTVKSCTMFAVEADGADVFTVEGISKEPRKLHPLQEAFWKNNALQCGYCTPGMLMSALFLLERNHDPSADEIKHGIAGNVCRCTGYFPIIKSIKEASEKMYSDGRNQHSS
jgi:aerobic carbon-monoxide dehydrogenase small subunit